MQAPGRDFPHTFFPKDPIDFTVDLDDCLDEDSDEDGVLDAADACLHSPGHPSLSGCPGSESYSNLFIKQVLTPSGHAIVDDSLKSTAHLDLGNPDSQSWLDLLDGQPRAEGSARIQILATSVVFSQWEGSGLKLLKENGTTLSFSGTGTLIEGSLSQDFAEADGAAGQWKVRLEGRSGVLRQGSKQCFFEDGQVDYTFGLLSLIEVDLTASGSPAARLRWPRVG